MKNVKKGQTIWFDLDNTLSDFSITRDLKESLENYLKPGFFKSLVPINATSRVVLKMLQNQGFNLGIITHSPHDTADLDKIKWVEKYYPFINKFNILCLRPSENKADFISQGDILVDDRIHNLELAKQAGIKTIRACFHNPASKKWDLNIQKSMFEILEMV